MKPDCGADFNEPVLDGRCRVARFDTERSCGVPDDDGITDRIARPATVRNCCVGNGSSDDAASVALPRSDQRSGAWLAVPKPPASSAGRERVSIRGAQADCPCLSPTTRSRTRSSSGTCKTDVRRVCASTICRGATCNSGKPVRLGFGSRLAKTSATRSASSRRATKVSACVDSRCRAIARRR